MIVRVISDSSSDIKHMDNVDFRIVPLSISTDEKEFIDAEDLDVISMTEYMASYKGVSRTACPSVGAWLDAFEGADIIYIATLTGGLSGTYNSAVAAKEIFLQENPNAKVAIFDTLSAGPEIRLIVEKIADLVNEGKDFETVCEETKSYMSKTRLFFWLESLHNLAQNGRVNKLVASAVGVLGIRIFGTASDEGKLDPISKCRNEKKVISVMLENLLKAGYEGGKCYLAHVNNSEFAEKIKSAIKEKFGTLDLNFKVYLTRGLCGYYAERGGVLIGVEC